VLFDKLAVVSMLVDNKLNSIVPLTDNSMNKSKEGDSNEKNNLPDRF
jgi:hypothetical protein